MNYSQGGAEIGLKIGEPRVGARNKEATHVPEKGPFWTGDVPEKGGTSVIWAPREMELEHSPFLGSSERMCTRQTTQHGKGLSTAGG